MENCEGLFIPFDLPTICNAYIQGRYLVSSSTASGYLHCTRSEEHLFMWVWCEVCSFFCGDRFCYYYLCCCYIQPIWNYTCMLNGCICLERRARRLLFSEAFCPPITEVACCCGVLLDSLLPLAMPFSFLVSKQYVLCSFRFECNIFLSLF